VKSMSIKLLYGTGNSAKLQSMCRGLSRLNVEILGLNDMGRPIPNVKEIGNSPMENARIKAEAYFEYYGVPVFSCDSGLYFDGVPSDEQPGIHVRNVNGKCLSDEEMISHYSALAVRYNNPVGRYLNAICLIMDREHIYSSMDDSLATNPFILVSEPHPARNKGFPLDSLSVDINTGKYYYDLGAQMVDTSVIEVGVAGFLSDVLGIKG